MTSSALAAWILVGLHALVLALLVPFALHRLRLVALSRRAASAPLPAGASIPSGAAHPPHPASIPPTPTPPRVTVQLPVHNERHVVERLVDAACRLEHPRSRLQIQLLDDSTDDTTVLAERRARFWRQRGVEIAVRHRTARTGYKAGALADGLRTATGEFILILDADFVPAPTLLRDLLPSMDDPGVGMVQARWDHLNAGDSWLTRAQALLLDGHFLVEQRGRCRGGRFFNFNGTAGLWRRRALIEAGGWRADTLTEDLDISYRAQMAGWRFVMRDDIGAAAELPGTRASFLVQQRRWAQGGVQTACKILPALMRGPFPRAVKREAFHHLCGHLTHPLAFVLSLLIVPSAIAREALGLGALWWLDPLVFLLATVPFVIFYAAAARRRNSLGESVARESAACDSTGRDSTHPDSTGPDSTRRDSRPNAESPAIRRTPARRRPRILRAIRQIALTLAVGCGLSLQLIGAALRGLGPSRDPFRRTPKSGGAVRSSYEPSGGGFPGRRLARAAGLLMAVSAVVAVATGHWGSLPFVALFGSGHILFGFGPGLSRARRTQRRPGRGKIANQQRPHRKPEDQPDREGLRPDSARQVRGQPPVAEECEAA